MRRREGELPVFVDSNVLVYMVDADALVKRDAARTLILDLIAEGRLVLSTQVLQEFYWVVTRKMAEPFPAHGALSLCEQLAPCATVAPSLHMVLEAMRRSAGTTLPLWDALVLTAAEASGAAVLYTEDAHLLRAPTELRVVDPFEGSALPDSKSKSKV